MITIESRQSLEEANPKIVNRSRMEGAVIRDFAKSANLTTYIDFGCWVGLLAEQALKDNDFERAIMVDAVTACLNRTFTRINKVFSAEYYHLAIVADKAEDRQFCIPVHDTSCAGFGQPGLTIDVKQMEVSLFLAHLNLDLSKTYLKIDLEGLDLNVANQLHNAKLLPKVLHIEFQTEAEFDYLVSLLGETYTFPEKVWGHALYSMVLSLERGVLIGFDPDFAYM